MRANHAVASGLFLLAATLAPPGTTARAAGLSDIALLDRITWGASESAVAALHAMGRERWLAWQLHPTDDRLPPAAQAQIDALPVSRQSMDALVGAAIDRERALRDITDPAAKQLARQANQ